jgi:hypothetical protein
MPETAVPTCLREERVISADLVDLSCTTLGRRDCDHHDFSTLEGAGCNALQGWADHVEQASTAANANRCF